MFPKDAIDRVLNKLCGNMDFAFYYRQGAISWRRRFSATDEFVVEVKPQDGGLLLSWGWENSTFHPAFFWSATENHLPVCQDCGGPHRPDALYCSPLWVKATAEQLYDLVYGEVRRVANFDQKKRQLTYAELRVAFEQVSKNWARHLQDNPVELLHASEWPKSGPAELDYPTRQSCRLRKDNQVFELHRDKCGWVVEVTNGSSAEFWRFAEETPPQSSYRQILSRDLKAQMLWQMTGVPVMQ